MWARMRPMISACSVSKRPCSASRSAGSLARSLPCARSASTVGSVVPGDQRGEHRAAALAEQVRGDAVELDAGVFEELVQPAGLALAVADLRLAVAREVAQRADRFGRYQAAVQQAGLGQPADPLRV